MISHNDDAVIPEDIVNDSKNYYYLDLKYYALDAWVQLGGKIEYPKNIKFQVFFPTMK